ncbi:transport protein Sec31 homolog B-like protein, partial [Tanacetum coccineum]
VTKQHNEDCKKILRLMGVSVIEVTLSIMPGISGMTALKLICKHGSIETILENINRERYQIPEDWPYEELGLDKIKGSDMTVHNSNLQMDVDDQDSSTVIIGYCPDMFPSVVAISWCPHDSSYLLICAKDDRTILWDTISVEIASELPVGTNLNLDEHWHPKLHGVISASSFHGKISIYNIEPCTQYSVGKDSCK